MCVECEVFGQERHTSLRRRSFLPGMAHLSAECRCPTPMDALLYIGFKILKWLFRSHLSLHMCIFNIQWVTTDERSFLPPPPETVSFFLPLLTGHLSSPVSGHDLRANFPRVKRSKKKKKKKKKKDREMKSFLV